MPINFRDIFSFTFNSGRGILGRLINYDSNHFKDDGDDYTNQLQLSDTIANQINSSLDQSAVDARVAAGVADWAETGNTDDIPHSKLPAGVDQTEAIVHLAWNGSTSWTAADVVVSTTGIEIQIPAAEPSDTQLEFLVRIDVSTELRDILIDGSATNGAQTFPSAPTAFMLDGVLYQHYVTGTLDAATRTALSASTIEIRLAANTLDQHIEYEVEDYFADNPVIEGVTLSDAAFQTLNTAGQRVNLSWPSALTQSGSGGGDAQVNAMHAISISEFQTSALSGAVSNPANAFDGNSATSTTFQSGSNVLRGQVPRTIYGGRIAINVTPPSGGSITFQVQFWLGGVSRGVVTGGAITSAGEFGYDAPLTTWNRAIITATAFIGGSGTVSEVRALDSNSALPGVTTAQLTAETTAREAGDSALSTRIDGLVTTPSADETLLDLVASTYPRDIMFTLGTRVPGGSDPGYNAGSHSLNAVGSFAETGIPTDIVTIYRATESEVIGGVQLQNRLIVGIDEEGGSRRYEGEAIRWGGQLVTLTYFQRSLNNFNEYYTDVVTTLSTAGQTVAFNVEDVQAEARETIPYRRWIWHHSVATTTEHISNDDFTTDTASQTLAPTQHAVAAFVPELPDAPDHAAAATRYELNVPATSGAPTWEEPQGVAGGPGTGHFLKLPALVSGNVDLINVNIWATDANTPDLTLAESYDDDVIWAISPGVQNGVRTSVAFFRPKDLLAVANGAYGTTAADAQRLSFTFNHNTTVFFLHLGRTADRKLLVAGSNAGNDPAPLTIWETRVGSGTPGTVESVRTFYMTGQTTRYVADVGAATALTAINSASPQQAFVRLVFNTTPNESLFNPTWNVDWRTHAEAIADLADRVGTETFPNGHFFRLPEGLYDISARVVTEVESSRAKLGLVRAQTGSDDVVEEYALKADSAPTQNNPLSDNAGTTAIVDARFVSVPSGGATFYIPCSVGNEDAENFTFSGYLTISRLRQ